MRQIIHYFRKDLRQHWPLLLACVLAVVAYAWHEIHIWGTPTETRAFNRDSVSKFWAIATTVIVPISWFAVIFRVIQCDSLVGQRQFWVTRPYEWKKLLAAKALFIVIAINLTLLIAGVFLLMRAGFSPAPHWAGLLWMQLLLWPYLLTMAALAVVTRTLTEALLVALGLALFVVGTAALYANTGESAMSSSEVENWLSQPVLIAGCLIVIWIQYSMRKTTLARIWLAAGGVVLLFISFTPRFLSKDHQYPLASDGRKAAFEGALGDPDPDRKKAPPLQPGEEIELAIPILLSRLGENELASMQAVRLTLDAANGFHWSSGWQSLYGTLRPGVYRWSHNFKIGSQPYQQASAAPAKARISIAADIYRDGQARSVTIENGEFDVPGVGRCIGDARDLDRLHCHAPLVRPRTMLLRMAAGASTCPGAKDMETEAYEFSPNEKTLLAEEGFSPVASFGFSFTDGLRYTGNVARICPGTTILLSFPRLVERTTVQADADQVNIKDYRYVNPYRGGDVRITIK